MPDVTIYFADLTHCGTVTNADTFPYGVGCIAAYAKKVLGAQVSVELFKLPHELDAALKAKTPDVLCFSNYVWNYYLGSAFARRVKNAWPHAPIVMGGPNICVTPEGRHRFVRENPWIDFYIKCEGERGFAGLLGALMDRSPNVASVREQGRCWITCSIRAAVNLLRGSSSGLPS
jgi:B12 binding domain